MTPLHDVMFCVVDFETTGASARDCEIVEAGAVRSRGGHPDGTFQSLVRPDGELPPFIQDLTGIRPAMLESAAPITSVLPSLLEFASGAVFVAHNARFDYSFLLAACDRWDYPRPLLGPLVDTARLARRLAPDAPNRRLQTLATMFEARMPTHRAFADAAACLDVLHGLIERAADYGATTLEELLEIQEAPPRAVEPLRLTRNLPRLPAVYILRDRRGGEVATGWAADVRSGVRAHLLASGRSRARRAVVASVDTIPSDVPTAEFSANAKKRERPRDHRHRIGSP